MSKPNQPREPIDGFEIRKWRVSSVRYAKVKAWRAVYHVNTPWAKLFPGDGIGAPFVDQWAIYEDERLEGRSNGWEWSDDSWQNFHDSEEAAKAAAAERARALITSHRRDIADLRRALSELEAPTPLDVAIRQLFADIAANYQGYDIIAGWNVCKGTPEGDVAETALNVVVQELLEKAITG